MKKSAVYGITTLAIVSLLTGCGSTKLKNGEELVAKVDGYKVTADDLYKSMMFLGNSGSYTNQLRM